MDRPVEHVNALQFSQTGTRSLNHAYTYCTLTYIPRRIHTMSFDFRKLAAHGLVISRVDRLGRP